MKFKAGDILMNEQDEIVMVENYYPDRYISNLFTQEPIPTYLLADWLGDYVCDCEFIDENFVKIGEI